MKSSTIRRSNLSKEKIAVLEALSKFNNSNDSNSDLTDNTAINNEPMDDASPEVYVRQNKEKELDILWKDFKMPKGERSPIVYLGMGFFAGVITTLLVSAFIGMSSGNFHPNFSFRKPAAENAAVTVPAENSAAAEAEAVAVAEAEAETTNAEPEAKPAKKFSLFGSKNNAETAAETTAPEMKEYVVQEGDTMDRIVRNFYGGYSEEKVNSVMKANNMTNPNKLSIGQKLTIPLE